MELEANQVSRDWTILHKGRRFYVNYTESDGPTLALCNRENWEVSEETEEGIEELAIYVFRDASAEQRTRARENFELMKRLIRFCIEHWDNDFLQEITKDLEGQKEVLETL